MVPRQKDDYLLPGGRWNITWSANCNVTFLQFHYIISQRKSANKCLTAKMWNSTPNRTYNLLDLNSDLTCRSQNENLQSTFSRLGSDFIILRQFLVLGVREQTDGWWWIKKDQTTVWIRACLLQCFDTAGWVTGKISATCLQRFSSGTHTHTQPFYCSSEICPGPPGWAGTRKVKPGRLKPIWIYWSKR